MTHDGVLAADLVVGDVYATRSRNLIVSVWTGRGFIGIREKFGYRYLFEEYYRGDEPGSGGPMGTARATRRLGKTTVRPLEEGNVALKRVLARFEAKYLRDTACPHGVGEPFFCMDGCGYDRPQKEA